MQERYELFHFNVKETKQINDVSKRTIKTYTSSEIMGDY